MVPLLGLLVALPPALNMASGLTYVWTPLLPSRLLHLLANAALVDAWLLLDLLAASGVLGGFAVVTVAVREAAVAGLLC